MTPEAHGSALQAAAPDASGPPHATGAPNPAAAGGKRPSARLWVPVAMLCLSGVFAVWSGGRHPSVVVESPRASGGAVGAAAVPALAPLRPAASNRADAPLDMPLADVASLTHAATRQPGSFDARLLDTYARFAAGDADGAVAAARRLTETAPASGLAQLVYADMLRLRAGIAPSSGWGASAPARDQARAEPSASAAAATARLLPGSEVSQQTRLDDLLAEARARVAHAQSPVVAGALPSQFVQLAAGVGHVIAVDVARARVYVLSSSSGGWTVTRDYYASVGKLGADKLSEGDLRTPLGVYFVTGTVPKGRLADRFGSTALTLNYPNQYDQLRGRTGNGIWLHGVPASLYARAPLATDGCVALSNDDMNDLARQVDRQWTPILIAPTLDWVPADRPDATGEAFLAAFARWRAAHGASDPGGELPFYSGTLRTPAAASGPAWDVLLRNERGVGAGPWAPTLSDVSVVGWHDDRPVMVVTFRERDRPVAQAHLRRQYWVEEAGHWRIIYEGDVG